MSVDKRKEIALIIGTDADNIEEDNGMYYVCTRSVGGVITHKYPLIEDTE
ncbi:hypothetical protein [Paenibacillus sp. Marseille-Q9583]